MIKIEGLIYKEILKWQSMNGLTKQFLKLDYKSYLRAVERYLHPQGKGGLGCSKGGI